MSDYIDSPLLAFPRKRKPPKEPKPMKRSQIKKRIKSYKKNPKAVPEESLQNFADKLAQDIGLDSNHVPAHFYEWLGSKSLEVDHEIKSWLVQRFSGLPDIQLVKNIEGTPYQLLFNCELKKDQEGAELNTNQKRWFKGKNHKVLRTFETIEEWFGKFKKY